MKRIVLILILTLTLSTVARAETSSTDELLENLSKTWNSLVKVAEESSKNISEWAEKSGVKEWVEGAIDDVNAQTKRLAEQLEELNAVYARMVEALKMNMKA